MKIIELYYSDTAMMVQLVMLFLRYTEWGYNVTLNTWLGSVLVISGSNTAVTVYED